MDFGPAKYEFLSCDLLSRSKPFAVLLLPFAGSRFPNQTTTLP